VELGVNRDEYVFDMKYPFGRMVRLVNVYDQQRQVERVRSHGRLPHTARWREMMQQNKILLGRNWNAHSDRWNPQCPRK